MTKLAKHLKLYTKTQKLLIKLHCVKEVIQEIGAVLNIHSQQHRSCSLATVKLHFSCLQYQGEILTEKRGTCDFENINRGYFEGNMSLTY